MLQHLNTNLRHFSRYLTHLTLTTYLTLESLRAMLNELSCFINSFSSFANVQKNYRSKYLRPWCYWIFLNRYRVLRDKIDFSKLFNLLFVWKTFTHLISFHRDHYCSPMRWSAREAIKDYRRVLLKWVQNVNLRHRAWAFWKSPRVCCSMMLWFGQCAFSNQ